MRIIIAFFLISLLNCTAVLAQRTHQTRNLVIISMDGYRWKELFGGADSALIFNSQYNKTKFNNFLEN